MRSSLAAAARALPACLLLPLLAGCTDRQRPSPLDPGVGMSVDVTSPDDGDSTRPGDVPVTLHGHDGVGRLNALGVVLRTAPAPGTFIDSVVVHFPATVDTTVVVHLQITRITKPTGMELRGLAFNATGGVVRTGPRALTVLP